MGVRATKETLPKKLPLLPSSSGVLWGLGLQPSIYRVTLMKCMQHYIARNLYHSGLSMKSRNKIILLLVIKEINDSGYKYKS